MVVVDLKKRVLDLVDLERKREREKILMLMLLTWANEQNKEKPRSFFLLIIPKMPSASGTMCYSREYEEVFY